MPKIFLVSPVRDEVDNLPKLFAALGQQSVPIEHWVICQNGSTDGTIEFLRNTPKPASINKLTVLDIDVAGQGYALGFTYSRIVNHGFQWLAANSEFEESGDYIGILDADCFPEQHYYEKLIREFEGRSRLGVLSGVLTDDKGRLLPRAKGFPRGNCRLWRRACFMDAGYVVGMSADALSAIKAQVRGWDVDSISSACVVTRDIGARAGLEYYGRSSYYRGETPLFALLKTLKNAHRPGKAISYAKGYFVSYWRADPVVDDQEIVDFSRKKLARIFLGAK